LVRVYGPLVYRWCRQWGLQPADAENVGQEVLSRVARSLAGFRRDRGGTFRGWLYRIASNCYADHLRRLARQPAAAGGNATLDQIAAEAERDEGSRDADTLLLYRRALGVVQAEVSARDWSAFYLVVAEDKSPAEVAELLHTSVNVVYLAKSRVLRLLRQQFPELMSDEESEQG
jgi:RNA polymerase sigma-70 factor (ECF subfamily)